jgi:hypothetical protein
MDEISALPPSPDDRAGIARQVNAHILEMAESLDSVLKDERPIGFLCECGCLGFVESTPADFRASGGAWIEGHR